MKNFPLRHGIFMAPYHMIDENPTVMFRRDLELVQWLDTLGFEEAWFGEHHSSGFETIGSPELMIAAVAEITKSIRLGTGVISLPFHNPLMVANRIIQLDHMTRGRVMFGAGPGLLPTDASMLGIDIQKQRDMMATALDIIIRLFKGEKVTATSSWFSLQDARVHILPYSFPHPHIAVASAYTPSGGMLAGKHGLGMLCVAATDSSGFDALGTNWQIANEVAEQNGHVMEARSLRLVGSMHIAETRELARSNVQYGLERWCEYYSKVAPKGVSMLVGRDPVDALIESGRAIIGTPADAIAQIERLQKKQGEFGVFLTQCNDWADWEQTKKSFELYARFVMPHFSGVNRIRRESYQSLSEDLAATDQLRQFAVDGAFERWNAHKIQADTAPPPAGAS